MEKYLNELANLATKAVLYEVSLSPKPGLVDRFNNGAHRDMTFYHFVDSALALQPYFKDYLQLGYEFEMDNLTDLFDQLRKKGVDAEKAMFTATNQVNTHKGLNFAYAVILGAIGYYLKQESKLTVEALPEVFGYVQQMAAPLVEKDLAGLTSETARTHGEKLYVQYGILGPRGEAAKGYPNLLDVTLPYIQKRNEKGIDDETIYLETLLLLMSTVEDGNIINRGGIEAWRTIQREAAEIFNQKLTPSNLRLALEGYNEVLVDRYLSPGGAADLLSLSIFLTLVLH